MNKILIPISILFSMISCSNNQEPAQMPAHENTSAMEQSRKYTPEMVVNKKDFVCGMPTTAGISDTSHYKGNAYGFCSAECKAAFLLDPQSYVAIK